MILHVLPAHIGRAPWPRGWIGRRKTQFQSLNVHCQSGTRQTTRSLRSASRLRNELRQDSTLPPATSIRGTTRTVQKIQERSERRFSIRNRPPPPLHENAQQSGASEKGDPCPARDSEYVRRRYVKAEMFERRKPPDRSGSI